MQMEQIYPLIMRNSYGISPYDRINFYPLPKER
jgi:hypothetical protein